LAFFAANIRNPHTRRAYSRAVAEFIAWCEDNRVTSITAVQPLHVSAWIEQRTRERAAPTVKPRLAALHHLFDWLVARPGDAGEPGRIGAWTFSRREVLQDAGAGTGGSARTDRQHRHHHAGRIAPPRADRIDGVQLRADRRGSRHESGGRVHAEPPPMGALAREGRQSTHAMPCHHNLETHLTAYIAGAGLDEDPKGPLFRTIGRGTGLLTRTPLPQRNAYAMVGRRATAADIATGLGNHSFRATGITAYLKNGGTLEKAAQMANHASTHTTQLYDCRREELSLDEVARIRV
jgi:site-specific recombinase XerC